MKEATIASLSCSNSVIFVLLLFLTLSRSFDEVQTSHGICLCTITTYSKVVFKISKVPQMVFVLVQDFIHSRLLLHICGAVIGREVAKSISEMALRLQHHHRRYLIESTCKRCVGVSEYSNE